MSKLPKNWEQCQFGDVTQIISGGTPSTKDPTNFAENDGIPWITPSDLSGYKKVYISRGVRNLSEKGFEACSATKLPTGSVLFSSRAPIGYVAIAANELTTNQGFKSFVLPEGLDSRFVYFYLRHIKPVAEDLATGTTFKELSGSKAARLPLIIAPSEEQKRIANKLENLMARIDACQTRLDHVRLILDRLRQAVLSAATSGALTEDWREEHETTEAWKTVSLPEVATSRLGKMLDKAKNQGTPINYLRNANVRWFDFDLTDIQTIRVTEDEIETFSVRRGDVFICEGGEPGRCAVWYGPEDEYVFQKALHRVRVGKNLTPEWLCYCLKVAADSGSLEELFTGTTIKHLTGVALNQFEFELPSYAEQHEIVRRVEKLFDLTDRVETRYRTTQTHIEHLTPALLFKAFRGELVPQDPSDEHASVLLRRIQAERATKIDKSKGVSRSRQSKETKMNEESVKQAIRQLPTDIFSFDELRGKLAGDYDKLKDIIFTLLSETEPSITQVFDKTSQAIRFVRKSE